MKDGGIKVYEQVKLPRKMFNDYGDPNFFKSAQRSGNAYIRSGNGYESIWEMERIVDGSPGLTKHIFTIARQSDGKVLGTRIIYSRKGGDILPHLGPDSSAHCPEGVSTSLFLQKIFLPDKVANIVESPMQPTVDVRVEVLEEKVNFETIFERSEVPLYSYQRKPDRCRQILKRNGLKPGHLLENKLANNLTYWVLTAPICRPHNIWNVNYQRDKSSILLSKLTNDGELVYTVNLPLTRKHQNLQSHTLLKKNGYVHYELWEASRSKWHDKTKVKFKSKTTARFKEPV